MSSEQRASLASKRGLTLAVEVAPAAEQEEECIPMQRQRSDGSDSFQSDTVTPRLRPWLQIGHSEASGDEAGDAKSTSKLLDAADQDSKARDAAASNASDTAVTRLWLKEELLLFARDAMHNEVVGIMRSELASLRSQLLSDLRSLPTRHSPPESRQFQGSRRMSNQSTLSHVSTRSKVVTVTSSEKDNLTPEPRSPECKSESGEKGHATSRQTVTALGRPILRPVLRKTGGASGFGLGSTGRLQLPHFDKDKLRAQHSPPAHIVISSSSPAPKGPGERRPSIRERRTSAVSPAISPAVAREMSPPMTRRPSTVSSASPSSDKTPASHATHSTATSTFGKQGNKLDNAPLVQDTDSCIPDSICPVAVDGAESKVGTSQTGTAQRASTASRRSTEEPHRNSFSNALLPGSEQNKLSIQSVDISKSPSRGSVRKKSSSKGKRTTGGGSNSEDGGERPSERPSSFDLTNAVKPDMSKSTPKRSRTRSVGMRMSRALSSNLWTVNDSKIRRLLRSQEYEYTLCALVILNAATIGVETEYRAKKLTNDVPLIFIHMDMAFCCLFMLELLVRIAVFGFELMRSENWRWNAFDCGVIATHLLDVTIALATPEASSQYLFILRVMRIVRIVRLVRILRLISELRTIFFSVIGSLRSLFWTLVLLCMIIYLFAVVLTNLVLEHRLVSQSSDDMVDVLDSFYGSLLRTMLSLYQAMTGGVDWDNISRPLMSEISPFLGVVLSLYIAFMVLALMNVVTGVFVDSSMRHAKKEQERFMVQHCKELFARVDIDGSGKLSWEELQMQMSDPDMLVYFKLINMDVNEAAKLFQLLDLDGSGEVDFEEFVSGAIKLHSQPRAVDLVSLSLETRAWNQHILEHLQYLEEVVHDEMEELLEAEGDDSRKPSITDIPNVLSFVGERDEAESKSEINHDDVLYLQ